MAYMITCLIDARRESARAGLKAIERLGLDIELPEATSGGAYHAWSPEQIEAWRDSQPSEPEMEAPCLRPF